MDLPVDGSNETVADELEQFNRYVASEHCHHFRPVPAVDRAPDLLHVLTFHALNTGSRHL